MLRQGRGVQRLMVLAILLRLARMNRGPVLIGAFEEPEEALEPLRQTQAAQMLRDLSSAGGQVFVTTHSPDVVRSFDLGDIVLIEPGPRPTVVALAEKLTGPARFGLERRIESPFARGLFVPVPVVGEGPSDKAVFDAFWRHLASEDRVRPAEHLGIDAFGADGVTMMPMAVQVLREAGKDPVAWVEQDDPRAQVIVNQGFAAALLLYPADPLRNNLEKLISQSFDLGALVEGMTAVANDRGEDWAAQLQNLVSRVATVVQDPGRRAALRAATDLPAAMAALQPAEARDLIALCLALAKEPAPFGIKSTRPARLFAEALVARSGVVEPFASAFEQLGAWAAQAWPRPPLSIQM